MIHDRAFFRKIVNMTGHLASNFFFTLSKVSDSSDKVFFHHKWNNAQLLLINMVYISCFTSCQTTLHFRRWAGHCAHTHHKNFISGKRPNPIPHSVMAQHPAPLAPAKMKASLILAKNSWKTQIKPFGSSLFHMKTRVSLKHILNNCR